MARRFGYSRVSTSDQDWSFQLEALTKAGVDDRDIFREKASGAKRGTCDEPQRPAYRRKSVADGEVSRFWYKAAPRTAPGRAWALVLSVL